MEVNFFFKYQLPTLYIRMADWWFWTCNRLIVKSLDTFISYCTFKRIFVWKSHIAEVFYALKIINMYTYFIQTHTKRVICVMQGAELGSTVVMSLPFLDLNYKIWLKICNFNFFISNKSSPKLFVCVCMKYVYILIIFRA